MLSATLGPPIEQRPSPLPSGATEQHIAIHRLQGPQKQWADRLLVLFQGKAVEGVEWSLKFQLSGLSNERFLLGLHCSHWQDFDFSLLLAQLKMPPRLCAAFQAELPLAVMLYVAFEATDDVIFYRVYLELPPGADPQHAGVHGSGYKWNPLLNDDGVVTRYRERTFQSREHALGTINQQLSRIESPVIRQAAQSIFDLVGQKVDPSGFMFLDVDEPASSRRSFTLTFNGTELAVHECVPGLIRLAHGLALSEAEVVRAFLPNDPRVVRSVAMGRARDGHEFFTFYYG